MTNDEEQLIERARKALSDCNWTVGECAAIWTKRYARGRNDQAFAELIGLSADRVYQRRRVWETFSDVRESYSKLSWSHFYAATSWDDAAECLAWAEEMGATVAEMRAWRRAHHGEDLSEPEPEENRLGSEIDELQETVALSGPSGSRSPAGPVTIEDTINEEPGREPGREAAPYAPFRNTARGPAAADEPDRRGVDLELVAKRIAIALERCDQALSPELIEGFGSLPYELQERVARAIDQLAGKATMFPADRRS